MSTPRFRPTWRLIPALAALGLTGCSTLPNTQPFTDATGGLRGAVASVGAQVTAELTATALLQEQGKKFDIAWKARNEAMGALVTYANSVQAIVDAGEKGEEAAGKLSDATKKLATVVGVLSPAGSAGVDLAVDAFKLASGEIAKFRAAKTLEKSLADMQPVIEEIARKLAADFKEARGIIVGAREQERTELTRLPGNGASDDYRRALVEAQGAIQKRIAVGLGGNASPLTPEQQELTGQLTEIVKKIAQLDESAAYKVYRARLDDIAKRGRLTIELIAETEAAIGSWAAAHGQMLVAVRTKRAPSALELLAAVGRIQGLLERFHKL